MRSLSVGGRRSAVGTECLAAMAGTYGVAKLVVVALVLPPAGGDEVFGLPAMSGGSVALEAPGPGVADEGVEVALGGGPDEEDAPSAP